MNGIELKECRDVILDSINEGVFTVDLNWRITSFNRAAEKITGVKSQDAIGQQCSDVFRASICENDCALRQTLSTGIPTVERTVYIINATGQRIPIKISAAVLQDDQGLRIGGVETFQDLRQIEELRKKLQKSHTVGDIVGQSPAITHLFDLLPQIADSLSNVLIEGATGTGKELVARAIHNLSDRRKKRFIAVNCGSLPDTLLESELFGYKRGAFTDAKQDKPGRFALADGGSLFLDEIGDVSPAMQMRLLRVLQERTFEPLGSVETVRTNMRVIAATNQNLRKLVEEGTFREDLFYRIHVLHIDMPRLRDRREDLPLLIDHFIDRYNRLQGKEITGLAEETVAILMEYDYPGNIRELQNIIEHAFVLCQNGLIHLQHLPQHLRDQSPHELFGGLGGASLKSMERVLIEESLRRHAGNRTLAAKELGINSSTLFRKIRSLKAEVPEQDGRQRRSR
ncbi:MAG: sigma 54-interacting transcriptional regulator [Deltaproteobacteria bacterium]|nr:sigma 54-interacting transcriptional regulator [Deltaproteobacteria bacterium]